MVRLKSVLLSALGLLVCTASTQAADTADVPGSLDTAKYHVEYVKLGAENLDGLLYEPKVPNPSHIALVSVFPRAGFGVGAPEELAARGYRVLKVQPYVEHDSPYDGIAEASAGIRYMRTLPGVDKVLIMGHSGGAHLTAFYTNVALNGPKGCQRPEVLYPCRTQLVAGLAKPDGAVLLDPGVGPINTALSIDPTIIGNGSKRTRLDLDMFSPANGYDPATYRASYSPEFLKKFYAAQHVRNELIVNQSLARMKQVKAGKGEFAMDVPLAIPGMFNDVEGPAPYQSDLTLLNHTKVPHTVLKPDGTIAQEVVHSVRPPEPRAGLVGSLCCASLNYSLGNYLANDAIRTTKDYKVTEDDVVGIDWKSSVDSSIANAEGITVPAIVLVNTCYRLVVTSEILFNHLATKDKTFVASEGAAHNFGPCRPEYGDTKKRAFDYVADWLSKPGRF